MPKTWHASNRPFLTAPELRALLGVITSTRAKALFLLTDRHGLRWGLARLCEAFLRLRLTACAAGIPTHDMTPQSLPPRGESHLSVHNSPGEGCDFWPTSVGVLCWNRILSVNDAIQNP
jgi:hypothetical protein